MVGIEHVLWDIYTGLFRSDLPNIIQVTSGPATFGAVIFSLKKLNCTTKGCWRTPALVKVEGTTYRTCHHHATREIHAGLRKQHKEKRPEQHDLLSSGDGDGPE